MKTLISFNKKLCGLHPETWNIHDVVNILDEFIPQLFPKAKYCLYYRQYTDQPLQLISKESEQPFNQEELLKMGSSNRDFLITSKDSADDLYFLMPLNAKKKAVILLIVYGKKKKLTDKEERAEEIHSFMKEHFARLKNTKKLFMKFEGDIQSRRFNSLRKFLSTRKTVNRKYIQKYIVNPKSESLVLTDFANVYKPDKDKTIFCLSDITCSSEIRHEAAALIDASIHILSKTDISFCKYLSVIDASLREKLAACYLSIACMLYDEKNKRLEICGAGSCMGLFYEHDSGTIKKIQFNDPLGTTKQNFSEPVKIKISAGDAVIIFSDGMLENKKTSGSEYGIDFIYSLFQKNTNLPVSEQAELIEKAYREILDEEEMYDDCTIQMYKFE